MPEEIDHNCGLCIKHSLHDTYLFTKLRKRRGEKAIGIASISFAMNFSPFYFTQKCSVQYGSKISGLNLQPTDITYIEILSRDNLTT